jgi:hypothetical protein
MKGVTKVGLSTSEKSDGGGAAGTSDSAAGSGENVDCSQTSSQRPKFNLVIFYGEGTPASGDAAAGATQPASGGSQ